MTSDDIEHAEPLAAIVSPSADETALTAATQTPTRKRYAAPSAPRVMRFMRPAGE